jgi:hypothetical protein
VISRSNVVTQCVRPLVSSSFGCFCVFLCVFVCFCVFLCVFMCFCVFLRVFGDFDVLGMFWVF